MMMIISVDTDTIFDLYYGWFNIDLTQIRII